MQQLVSTESMWRLDVPESHATCSIQQARGVVLTADKMYHVQYVRMTVYSATTFVTLPFVQL